MKEQPIQIEDVHNAADLEKFKKQVSRRLRKAKPDPRELAIFKSLISKEKARQKELSKGYGKLHSAVNSMCRADLRHGHPSAARNMETFATMGDLGRLEAEMYLSQIRLKYLEKAAKETFSRGSYAAGDLRHLLSYWDGEFPFSNDPMRAHAMVEGVLLLRDPCGLLAAERERAAKYAANGYKGEGGPYPNDTVYEEMAKKLGKCGYDENCDELPEKETVAQMLRVMGLQPEDRAGVRAAKAVIKIHELVYPY